MSTWDDVRNLFPLRRDVAQFATLEFASHPEPVSRAIAKYREILDVEAFPYFRDHSKERRVQVLKAIADYFDVEVGLAALTHATTVGLAQVLGGVRVSSGQEFLAGRNEHPAAMETLRLRADRDGVPYRQVSLYRDSRTVTAAEVLQNVAAEIRPWTRVLVLTWVCSSDGVKLPIPEIAALVERENQRRVHEDEQLLFVVDGVHGFGIEDTTFTKLGCDFFIAGCHKSIFGPRGTGIICGKRAAWRHIVPIVGMLSSANEGPASRHVPGGVHTYEHWWALKEAFELHLGIGKHDIETRVRELAGLLKTELSEIDGVVVVTPPSAALSSGLVCFDVTNKPADFVVVELEQDGIIASTSAPDLTAGIRHCRLAASILNNEAEVRRLVASVRRITRPPDQ
jgi:selenocysteine lyase/cysteine desulfurase